MQHDRQVRLPRDRRGSDGYRLDCFQQLVLLEKKKPPLSVQLGLLWKESVLSHRVLNRKVLCGHTRLSRAVSQRQTFEPSTLWSTVGFCLCVWSAAADERGSIGEGLFIVLGPGPSQRFWGFFFIQHLYSGLRNRKGVQHSQDFLFGIGISVFDVGGLGKVPSSVSIWGSRHQSRLVSFGTVSFSNSSRKLKRLLRVFICGSSSFWETVYPNQLFSLIMSHKPIFFLPATNRWFHFPPPLPLDISLGLHQVFNAGSVVMQNNYYLGFMTIDWFVH